MTDQGRDPKPDGGDMSKVTLGLAYVVTYGRASAVVQPRLGRIRISVRDELGLEHQACELSLVEWAELGEGIIEVAKGLDKKLRAAAEGEALGGAK